MKPRTVRLTLEIPECDVPLSELRRIGHIDTFWCRLNDPEAATADVLACLDVARATAVNKGAA